MGKKNKSRKARRTGTPVGEESVPSDCDEEVYEVECIVDHRNRRGGTEYKVRWRGWSPQFDEWLHYSKMASRSLILFLLHCVETKLFQDCPEAIKEYWLQHEARKSKEPSASKKRDHSDRHSVQSSSSRKSTSPPAAKRRLLDDSDLEAHSSADSGSVSPTISECLGEASSQICGEKAEPLGDLPSAEVTKAKSKDSSVEPSVGIDAVPRKASTTEPRAVSGVSSPSFKDQLQSSSMSTCSSPRALPQQPTRKSIPLPPALPKRKHVQSLSTTTTPLRPTNVPNEEQSATSESKQSDSDHQRTATPSISSEQEVKKGSDSREIQAKPVKKIESAPQEPFVRPHGFERGLTVERIHGFIQRADLLFAVVQFKNCDVVEILATQIVKHYEPMALIRGFEEHHIRSRRNAILSSPQPSSKQQR